MIKKYVFKKPISFAFLLSALNICFSFAVSAQEKSENFNFIKLEEQSANFVYDGSLLLYGGIFLIAVSFLGMLFSVLPKRKKSYRRQKHKKRKI